LRWAYHNRLTRSDKRTRLKTCTIKPVQGARQKLLTLAPEGPTGPGGPGAPTGPLEEGKILSVIHHTVVVSNNHGAVRGSNLSNFKYCQDMTKLNLSMEEKEGMYK